jgi:hypothetical protein
MTIEQVVARVQRLSTATRPEGSYPLAAYVEGYFLGDMTAIVAAAIRAERLVEHRSERLPVAANPTSGLGLGRRRVLLGRV